MSAAYEEVAQELRGGGNPNHDKVGRFASKAERAASSAPLDRAARATRFHKVSSDEKQRHCEANELKLQAALAKVGLGGGTRTTDGATMDLIITGKFGGKDVLHGIEVKTMVDNGNAKITMHPDSRKKKEIWGEGREWKYATDKKGELLRKAPTKKQIADARVRGEKPQGSPIVVRGAKTDVAYKGSKNDGIPPVVSGLPRVVHTVIFDDHAVYKGGINKALYTGHPVYYRRAVGAFEVKSKQMVRVRNMKHLRDLISGKVDR